MLIIAITPPLQDSRTIGIKMCGVILASLSSGGGELSFLGLTHYYGHFALASWGSGTGGAGLIGAGAYAIATTTLKISPRTSLLAFSFLPLIMIISFFVVLPRGPLHAATGKNSQYEAIREDELQDDDGELAEDNEPLDGPGEHEGLLSTLSSSTRKVVPVSSNTVVRAWASFKANLNRSKGLFFP
jgi:battenin